MSPKDFATPDRAAPDGRWLRGLAELALASAGSLPAEEGERLRELCRLLEAAPDPALLAGLCVPGPARIEVLLAAGAPESAALALLDGGAGYLLSRGGNGQHLASVVLPGADEELSASGDTLGLALIGALALADAATRPRTATRNAAPGGLPPGTRLN